MKILESFGWTRFREQINYQESADSLIGRVFSIKGFKYYIVSDAGEKECELAGRLLFGSETEELPKVGDWICFLDYGETGFIIDVLPRVNLLARKNPGTRTEKQVLAANIDVAFVVQGIDRDFNLNRLERYLVQLSMCGISPVVILNKADLSSEREYFVHEIEKLQRDCSIIFCSTLSVDGIDELVNALQPGLTYILIGSSGVGKSSILNALMNRDLQKTASMSELTSKGKHTTTTRDLFQLANGSMMIDTPGMREFGLTMEDSETSDALFPPIQELSRQCRYSDCTHQDEPGCAVLAALHNGELEHGIYESYLKLIKELRRFQVKIEDRKRISKQWGKMSRDAANHRKKNKF